MCAQACRGVSACRPHHSAPRMSVHNLQVVLSVSSGPSLGVHSQGTHQELSGNSEAFIPCDKETGS